MSDRLPVYIRPPGNLQPNLGFNPGDSGLVPQNQNHATGILPAKSDPKIRIIDARTLHGFKAGEVGIYHLSIGSYWLCSSSYPTEFPSIEGNSSWTKLYKYG